MRRLLCTIFAAGVASAAVANPVTIQPDEPQSNDAFAYQFLSTMNFNTGGFGALLGSGRTASGHDLRSFVQFDLSGVTLNPGETASLNLYVGSTAAAGFGVNPSPTAPVVTNVYGASSAWDEATLTWANQPATNPTVVAAQTIDGINQWKRFDVTPLVAAWLANPGANFGFAVTQDAIVTNNGPVVTVYDSAAGANKPFLQIVPEPASAVTLGAGAAALLLRRRRCAQ